MNGTPAQYRELNDAALLADCRWDAFRGPGPGGQKRNKTSNSMRLTHAPTGLCVVAGESRSQSENKARALSRLKMKLALEFRRPIDPRRWEPPLWIDQIRTKPAKNVPPGGGMRLQISHPASALLSLRWLVLDLLAAESHVADVRVLSG